MMIAKAHWPTPSGEWRLAGGLTSIAAAAARSRRFAHMVSLLIVSTGVAWPTRPATAQPAPVPDPARLKAVFHQDFRNRSYDFRELELVGRNAEQVARPESGGLRIRIPPKLRVGTKSSIGVAPRFRVRGDFEITVSYEIVKAETPASGFGLEIALLVETETPTKEAVTVERCVLVKKGDFFTSTRITGPPTSRKYIPKRVPAKAPFGTLRMARAGGIVTTSYADGDAPFRTLNENELGPEELTLVRLGADNGYSDHPLDIRLKALSIRAEALPGIGGTPLKTSSPYLAIIAGAAAGGLGLLGLIVWWRSRVARTKAQRPGDSVTQAPIK